MILRRRRTLLVFLSCFSMQAVYTPWGYTQEQGCAHLKRPRFGSFLCRCYTLPMFAKIFRLFWKKVTSVRVFSVFLFLSFAAFVLSTACHPIDYSTITVNGVDQCCSEQHELKNAVPTHLTVFDDAVLPGNPLGIAVIILAVVFTLACPKTEPGKPLILKFRERYLRWVWARSFPFSFQGAFLPYFFATRGA